MPARAISSTSRLTRVRLNTTRAPQFLHPQPTLVDSVEFEQDVVRGKWQAGRVLDLSLDGADHSGMGAQSIDQ
jgi:hypothetical protein